MPQNIVIVGGGIIGSTTAYFLSTHPSFTSPPDSPNSPTPTITLLEPHSLACAASGKAGGLLATWAFPACLARTSFALHADLAAQHNGQETWGYRHVKCASIAADIDDDDDDDDDDDASQPGSSIKGPSRRRPARTATADLPADLDWVDGARVTAFEHMAAEGATAQVHPREFTRAMGRLAAQHGVRIVAARATGVVADAGQSVRGVRYVDTGGEDNGGRDVEGAREKTLPADVVVVAAGPWTPRVVPGAPVASVRAHSVVIRPRREVSAYALFTELDVRSAGGAAVRASGSGRSQKKTVTPEIYARPGREVYACGAGDTRVPLPHGAGDVVVDEERACEDVVRWVGGLSKELREGEVIAKQACYLPNVAYAGEGPLVGETSTTGLFLATGHTCWGIQNAPVTGKVISEMVWEGKARCARVESLCPKRVGL